MRKYIKNKSWEQVLSAYITGIYRLPKLTREELEKLSYAITKENIEKYDEIIGFVKGSCPCIILGILIPTSG